MGETYTCKVCGAELTASETYEYRGAYSCAEHLDEMQAAREFERQEVIAEESAKTEVFRGLDLGDNVIGRANREILKPQIEIARKESGRLKAYERIARNSTEEG